MLEPLDPCRAAFARADREVYALAARTGLACPPGCGACCLSPDVETTADELRPLAAGLVRSGRAAEVLVRIEATPDEPRCALYAPDSEDGRLGRCTAYAERPLVCRMFGFAADSEPEPVLLGPFEGPPRESPVEPPLEPPEDRRPPTQPRAA